MGRGIALQYHLLFFLDGFRKRVHVGGVLVLYHNIRYGGEAVNCSQFLPEVLLDGVGIVYAVYQPVDHISFLIGEVYQL